MGIFTPFANPINVDDHKESLPPYDAKALSAKEDDSTNGKPLENGARSPVDLGDGAVYHGDGHDAQHDLILSGGESPGVKRMEVANKHMTTVERWVTFVSVFLCAYAYGLDGQSELVTWMVSIIFA